jgi:hypothetical protein
MTTMTVVFRDSSLLEVLRRTSWYFVPVAAHQCMPETAPARTTAQAARFHQAFVHEALKTKKSASETMLAATAMIAAPTTLTGEYMQT